jgi:hypothetical protein
VLPYDVLQPALLHRPGAVPRDELDPVNKVMVVAPDCFLWPDLDDGPGSGLAADEGSKGGCPMCMMLVEGLVEKILVKPLLSAMVGASDGGVFGPSPS